MDETAAAPRALAQALLPRIRRRGDGARLRIASARWASRSGRWPDLRPGVLLIGRVALRACRRAGPGGYVRLRGHGLPLRVPGAPRRWLRRGAAAR